MSGNGSDQSDQNVHGGVPPMPEVNIPPAPEMPALPWEQQEQQPVSPAQPSAPQPYGQGYGTVPGQGSPYQRGPAPTWQGAHSSASSYEQQVYMRQPGQARRGFPAWAGWLIGVGAVVVIAAVVTVGLVVNMLPGDDAPVAGDDDSSGGDQPIEPAAPAEPGNEAAYPLTEPVPGDLGFLWNTDGVTDTGWTFSTDETGRFEAQKGGQTCAFVGYVSSIADVNPDGGSAADDAAGSTVDFEAYLATLEQQNPDIDRQSIAATGTAMIETSSGAVEFQVYDVTIDWMDSTLRATNERWLWRSFVDSDTAMQAYVSCGQDDIEAEAQSLGELTVE